MRAAADSESATLGKLTDATMNAAFCGVTPMVRLGDLAAGPDAFADGPFGSNLKGDHYTDQGARGDSLGQHRPR